MAVIINIKKPEVVLEFKDDNGNVVESFIFDKSEGAHQRLHDVTNGFLKEIALSETKEDYSVEDMKKAFKPLIEKMLGEGSFNRLYKLAGSWDIFVYYFVQICTGITDEIGGNMTAMEELVAKYGNE